MNLASLSQVGDSQNGRAALAELLEDPLVKLFDQHSAFEEDATEFDHRPVVGSEAVQTRVEGGSYTKTAKEPEDKVTDALRFHGGGVSFDLTRKADAERGLRDSKTWHEKKVRREFLAWLKAMHPLFFNGDGTGELKGFANILDGVADIPGFTGKKGTIDAAAWNGSTDAFDLTVEANWPTFMKMFELATAEVPNLKAIVTSPRTAAQISVIAQRFHVIGESRDQFGVPVRTINSVPIVPMRPEAILHNELEKDGVGNTCTSIYLMRPAEFDLSIVTNSGLYWKDWDHLESKESDGTMWEIRAAIKIENEDAIRRIMFLKA